MRRSVAALLVLLLAALFVVDPITCPDGCSNDRPASHSATTAGAGCALCQNGMTVQQLTIAVAPTSIARAVAAARIETARSAPLAEIDHPPRES